MTLPADGLVLVLKRDCPTCRLVEPVVARLAAAGPLTVLSQDDPAFPAGVTVVDDRSLELSYGLDVETVPTLIRRAGGVEVERLQGWLRPDWERVTGLDGLGEGLPEHRPGCGSRTLEPGVAEELAVRFGGATLRSRRVEVAALEDEWEVAHDRGWSDGLPVVPPTEARVLAMLAGTARDPGDVVAVVPPDLVPVTVEKVAVNAVMAGCLPEHLPVVLAAVEGFCSDTFNGHGLLATTYFSGPLLVVNGPVVARGGFGSGGNALGQGNRANLTVGRALNLVVRNVGGGRPGGVDRATLGHPGKLGWCFAEDEAGSPFTPLAQSRGATPGRSAVTLFAGAGVTPVVDQLSRDPDSLARSFASVLLAVAHPKLALAFDALLVVCPEHARVLRDAGWDRERLVAELTTLTTRDGATLVRGAGDCAEGLPAGVAGYPVPKFRPGGLLVAHAGGSAGMFSAVIGGWVSGPGGSEPVTIDVDDPEEHP